MFKILTLGALLMCCAVMTRALPVDQAVDEMVEAALAGLSQTSQTVAEQEPKISPPKESDVDMSEQNKEAMENAETFGFGYRKAYHVAPRVFIPPYPLPSHAAAAYGYGFPAIPSYGGYVVY